MEGLPRKLTAIGTVGEANQLFTVYEKNWICTDCSQENYAARPRCSRCKKQKPTNVSNYVVDPALAALQAGKTIAWQEAIDPNTKQIYYFNKESGATQWERPEEMGPAPMATGWFGRGLAGSTSAQLYAAMNKVYLSRPARKQKDFIDPKKYHMEGANEYNIWYGRFLGDEKDKLDREAAADRCVLETDAGYTKADSNIAFENRKNKHYFCIYFAHGICARGADCIFYHRIPLPEDDAKCDELFDCFGRQRHSAHKDDMNGVGTFSKPCRTLFVGNLLKQKYATPKDLEDALWKHFGEWGELESLNVVHRISIAFPRYRLRTSAEFAKEAMSCQALDKGEILSIRWAHDDPNPVAQDSIDRANKDALLSLLQAKGISTKIAGFEYPIDYQLPEAKRLRIEEGGDVVAENPSLAYPDTDHQYGSSTGATRSIVSENHLSEAQSAVDPGSSGGLQPTMTPEEYSNYVQQYYQNYYNSFLQSNQGVTNPPAVNAPEEETVDDDLSSLFNAKRNSIATVIDTEIKSSEINEKEAVKEERTITDVHTTPVTSDPPINVVSEWEKFQDETTGATYFFNSNTGESSWTDPTK